MVEGADSWFRYINTYEDSKEDGAQAQFVLEHRCWAILDKFSTRRRNARNCMWGSLALILIALMVHNANSWSASSAVCITILLGALYCMHGLVMDFRASYRPLLMDYRLDYMDELGDGECDHIECVPPYHMVV